MKPIFLILVGLLICASGYSQKPVGDFHDGLTRVKIDGKYGFSDTIGNIVIPAKYDAAGVFSGGRAQVGLRSEGHIIVYGYIDKAGNEVVPIKYTSIERSIEGLAIVRSENSNFGIINKAGNEITPMKYYNIWDFCEGFAKVCLSFRENFGFVDVTGREITPLKYSSAENFSEGFAKVGIYEKYGYIDKTGNEVIPLKYDAAENFHNGIALVKLADRYGYVDNTGKEFLNYDAIEWNNQQTQIIVWLNGRYGIIDETGKEISPLKYSHQQKEQQIIWESPLITSIKQINKLQSDQILSTSSFTVNRPYIVVSVDNNEYGDIKEIYLTDYSEGTFDDQSINGLKMLIVKSNYYDFSRSYGYDTGPGSVVKTLKSYGAYIKYYDMATKRCVGYDRMRGPDLPRNISVNEYPIKTVDINTVLKQIVTHLKTSENEK